MRESKWSHDPLWIISRIYKSLKTDPPLSSNLEIHDLDKRTVLLGSVHNILEIK